MLISAGNQGETQHSKTNSESAAAQLAWSTLVAAADLERRRMVESSAICCGKLTGAVHGQVGRRGGVPRASRRRQGRPPSPLPPGWAPAASEPTLPRSSGSARPSAAYWRPARPPTGAALRVQLRSACHSKPAAFAAELCGATVVHLGLLDRCRQLCTRTLEP